MSGNRQLKVFLCHSKEDKQQVRELYKRLVADGIDTWLDEEKLIPGQDWDFEIRKAIKNTDAVIVCISKSSINKSGYVQKEIRLALDVAEEQPEGRIFLIPVRLEECKVPERLSQYQWADLFKLDGYAKIQEALQLRMNDLNIRFDAKDVVFKIYQDMLRIPVLGKISANEPFPSPALDNEYIEVPRNLLPTKENDTPLYALCVEGDGMKDALIYDGDVIVVKSATTAKNGDMVVVWLSDRNEMTFKYLYKEKEGYRLQPANPSLKPIMVHKSVGLEIKGKVVMVIRKA